MRQHVDFTSRMLKIFLFTLLILSGFSKEYAQGDSTFFPEDTPESATNNMAKEASDTIKEWAELKPTPKETAELVPPKQAEPKKLVQPQISTLEKQGGETQQAAASISATPDSKVSPVPEEQKPLLIATTPPSDPKASSDTQEKQPLQRTTVTPHPKARPVSEKDPTSASQKAQNSSPKTVLPYSEAANNRAPVGILEPTQEIHSQRWYIYSSAIRGLKNPSDRIHIVSMEGTAPKRGEEIKALLVDMGIEPEKVQLVHAKGEKNQIGVVYIFAGQ